MLVPTGDWTLVTSRGWLNRGLLNLLERGGVSPNNVVIARSPLRIEHLDQGVFSEAETIVAVGGGSAIDRAKVLALETASQVLMTQPTSSG